MTEPQGAAERPELYADTSDGPGRALSEVLARWRSAFDARHTERVAALFTPDALFQGLGTTSFLSRERVREYYERVPAGTRAEVRIAYAYRLDGALGGIAEIRFTHPDRVRTAMVSVVLTRAGEQWLIRHWHAAATGA
ncbi:nuclear transport factor 2 family protein [Streptomyces sp. AC602_WCS936]|uniref:nuclear transport factor 2 family protein n=1 Tax=Streptomyces sp. AC602_WCS936 TaxID=2823685 RepID=UPI001C273C93|nr:nuclear transport factor 2 family protein [Streptomyces sp. AC602_WCS936]